MAIKQNIIETKNGFGGQLIVPDAYWRVANISGTKERVKAVVTASASKESQILRMCEYEFVPSLEGVNFISQAYEHLKTLPEFAGAVDC
jgi:hypothetical protein